MQPARRLGRDSEGPIALHDRAMDNLRFIRETMERSTSFTAVSGWAGIVMGAIALVAAFFAARIDTPADWLSTWLVAAALSAAVALFAMARKSKAVGTSLLNGPGRKFVLGFAPPVAVGGVMTIVLFAEGLVHLLPGAWLLLYGAGVVTGGAYSVKSVPLMGVGFMIVGGATLLAPPAWGNTLMAVGFGVLHIVFGLIIWRKHGG